MDWLFLIFSLILATLFGIAGLLLGEFRGARPVAGFWLGFLLGPLGVIFADLGEKQCPACRSWIAPEATKCPRCHEAVEPRQPAPAESPTPDAVAGAMARAEQLRSKP